MTSTILVTGATGNIGSEVVKQLSVTGANVRAAVRRSTDVDEIKGAKVELVEFDFDKPEIIGAAFKGVEKLFLLTPFVPNMVEMGANLVERAKKVGIKHIVRLSGMGADIEPGITLGRWHREVEKMVEASGIPYTILRPNGFMQNYANFMGHTIKTQSAFYLPLGDSKTSYVDTRDIASVAVEVLTKSGHEGKAYNITGPDSLSNYQIAEILSTVIGRKINYVNVSDDDARKGMQGAGMPDWMVDALMELYTIQRAGYASDISPVVEQVTGKKPISFAQFARDYAYAFN
jgi:uncharacterized protein YbjT (DUF2867 family)